MAPPSSADLRMRDEQRDALVGDVVGVDLDQLLALVAVGAGDVAGDLRGALQAAAWSASTTTTPARCRRSGEMPTIATVMPTSAAMPTATSAPVMN